MRIKNIKFKVTASRKLKCHFCKKDLYGEEGFIHIEHKVDFGGDNGLTHTRICWNCLMNFLKKAEKDRADKKEMFAKLVKKNIIRHLK